MLQPGLVQFLALEDKVVYEIGFLAFLLDPADVAETGVKALVGGVWFIIFVSHIVIHYKYQELEEVTVGLAIIFSPNLGRFRMAVFASLDLQWGLVPMGDMFILELLLIVFDVKLWVLGNLGLFFSAVGGCLRTQEKDLTLFFSSEVLGILFLEGSLSLNYFNIYLDTEKLFLFIGSANDNPYILFFFWGYSRLT